MLDRIGAVDRPPGDTQNVRRSFADLVRSLKLPVVVAPMFLVSGPDLVVAACRAGVIGSFPAPNARTLHDLEAWFHAIKSSCRSNGASWAVNLIVHLSNNRFDDELRLVQEYQPPLVITALGSPARLIDEVHDYGGIVLADVSTVNYARKAVASGADGLVLVCAGAGGHTGEYSPFAFTHEVRRFWRGPIVLAGAISDARGIRAAQALGADLAYMGTRFIAARESLVSDDYRKMLVASHLDDVVTTKAVTGIRANFLRASLERAGFTADLLDTDGNVDFSRERLTDAKAWKSIWGAGQGVGCVERISTVSEIVADLAKEYSEVLKAEADRLGAVSDSIVQRNGGD